MNIILRDFSIKDFELYRHWNNNHKHRWFEFDGSYFPKKSPEEIEEFLNKIKSEIESNSVPYPRKTMVIARKDDDKLIGKVSSYYVCKETNWIDIGISLYDDSVWGQGLGFVALKEWINYLFQNHKDIVRLGLVTWSGNIGMIKLAQKLEFKQESCFRKARIVNDIYYDSVGFGILREEWELGGVISNVSSKL